MQKALNMMISVRRTSSLVLILFCFIFQSYSLTPQQERIEKIKDKSNIYKWGEGVDEARDKANTDAINNLISKIKLSVTGNTKNEWSNDESGNGYDQWTGNIVINSGATLENLEEISYQHNGKWHVFRYISEEDLNKSVRDRHDCERDLIEQAITQEGQLNIAGALKYYNWAYTMISHFKDDFSIEVGGKNVRASQWLPVKIHYVLNEIKLTIAEGKIEEDPDDYDRYTIRVNATYADKPVSALDVNYFNGERTYTAHAKSGELVMKFPSLEGLPKIDTNIVYSYHKEAQESAGNPELKSAFAATNGAYDGEDLAYHGLSLKYAKGSIKSVKDKKNDTKSTDQTSSELEPIIFKELATIDRLEIENPENYISSMQKVEQAIRSRQYETVRNLFTPEGYELFLLMTKKGSLSVASTPRYSVERSNLFTIGKSIPVAVRNGKHVSKENIVFRFDSNSRLIKSVAYALTSRAENDIFRQADWTYDSRYSLLNFMEDYQTAFALQRLDYIKQIFSNDAVIITGKFVNDKPRGNMFHEGDMLKMNFNKNVVFSKLTKDQYISNVERMFKNNSWTHIEFEENEISKSNTMGLLDHETMWIEIRQNWTSASGYNDTGFLGLQINLKPSGSLITVRTWSPEFIEIEDLKKKFSTEISF